MKELENAFKQISEKLNEVHKNLNEVHKNIFTDEFKEKLNLGLEQYKKMQIEFNEKLKPVLEKQWKLPPFPLPPLIKGLDSEILKDSLSNVKLEFNCEMDRLVLTVQSGSYAIKADVTDEVLPLVKEINQN